MNVATFGPPTLAAQLAELERELGKRASVYPMLIAKGKLTERQAAHQNRGLEGAIATLRRLAEAQARGEPSRAELVEALRSARLKLFDNAVGTEELDALLARLPA